MLSVAKNCLSHKSAPLNASQDRFVICCGTFFSLKRRVWVVRESFFSYGYNSNQQKAALPNHAANCITTCGVQEILQI